MECKKWERGEDCGWNQRLARGLLVPILLVVLGFGAYVLRGLHRRNSSWTARPVLCLGFTLVSLTCDVLENILVLTELRENGFDWYANSTIDAIGDIFLMYSLYLFAEIWCDNVRVLASSCSESTEYCLADLGKIRGIYKFVAIGNVPFAIIFSLGSVMHHYDSYMILYVMWGVAVGLLLLTPVAFFMYKSISAVPRSARDKPIYKQLLFMAQVNLAEQLLWNALMVVTIVSIVLFLQGGNKSAFLIGTASICISVCWILIHLQVILFFVTVTKAGNSSPVFDHGMLRSLIDDDTESSAFHSIGAGDSGDRHTANAGAGAAGSLGDKLELSEYEGGMPPKVVPRNSSTLDYEC